MTYRIDIPENTTQVIVNLDDPNLTIWLVVAAFGALGVSLLGVYLSNKNTQKSNSLTLTELRAKIRPLFELDDIKYRKINTTPSEVLESLDSDRMLSCKIKNSGTVPARNVKVYSKTTSSNNLDSIIAAKNSIKQETNKRNLGTIRQKVPVTFSTIIKPEDGQTFDSFLALWFEFEFLKSQKDSCIAVIELTEAFDPIPHQWFVKEDVE